MGLPVIKLGLVGAIAETAMSVLNSLLRQPRLQLTEVYDPCLALAQQNAQHLDASYSPSLDGLLRRSQGIVIGDVKWMGLEPILRAAEMQRPTLILESVLSQLGPSELAGLQKCTLESRTMLMPELSFRWARSTLRLRELTATQAGAIEHMELTCHGNRGSHTELLAFDWCVNVMQSEWRAVEVNADGRVTLKFRRPDREGFAVTAIIRFIDSEQRHDFPISEAIISCRHGRIHLFGEEKLDWEIERRKVSESLLSDRSASDVMFDLFGRRLVGGIVPIPEIADLIKSHEIRKACGISSERGGEVTL